MDRDQLIAEIKKQLQEELKHQTQTLKEKIPVEQRNQAKTVTTSVSKEIKAHPWIAVSLAAAAGFILARMLYKNKED